MQIYENNLICRQADRNSAFIRPKLRLCRDPSQPKNLTKWQIFNISKKFKKAEKIFAPLYYFAPFARYIYKSAELDREGI